MRKILSLAAALSLAAGSCPAADNTAAALIEAMGLVGTWASYCTPGGTGKPGLRIVFAETPDGGPTFTTVSADGPVTTTVRSTVLEAAQLSPAQLRLRLRIVGGDRDGGPLPNPTTNTFEQVIEKTAEGIRLVGTEDRFIQKCPVE